MGEPVIVIERGREVAELAPLSEEMRAGMILYLDASAVAKFFMPEAGAESVLAIASGAAALATALQLSRATRLPVSFLSFDKRLNQAATAACLQVPSRED